MLSILLCVTAIVVFKPHGAVVGIAVGVMVATVFSVLATFSWSGWRLGGIEAVALSILVGTSVDYIIHMVSALSCDPLQPCDHIECRAWVWCCLIGEPRLVLILPLQRVC